MPKYYVCTGDMKTVIVANNEKEAAVKAISQHIDKLELLDEEVGLGVLTKVGQRGFSKHQDDVYIATEAILNAIEANNENAGGPP